ncbi:hypothetical protein GGI25_002006 [Coemansia spiralis]|uniref:Thioesterase domain-containing protein n=2 Tax=Coemansia TaxID=4863 RepID=A0A9W8G4I1_9FUNG|nr:hypothetical protein BX070DRAFT_236357 [Coemansia spiralis]KAJ1992673.1 hypothetical protein EDC05_002616 [Coemansia umbellata]KAJ2623262.1 hypothetical protein GGI26_002489 [Coemansia sp. RSA 1358]KAJ2678814.1 hypothetical protein GGI25_002006 [Coemansia spiralis]
MSGFILNELLDKLSKRNNTRFGSSLELHVATADIKSRTVVYEYEVTEDEIFRGYLDSGWLSTVVDHATDPLICAAAGTHTPSTYTSSLTVHTLEPILPTTHMEIVCRLVQAEGRLLQTTVLFRDATRKHIVYASGVHSLLYKDGVGSGAKL